ncbi:hypothetical protein G7Y41_06990 [Schaalia sp. ZJ405]|uniref:hypothetical protein n=1 Tax=Schaalia sp. ZJ405 TaxID=2709403 RepID=UPI0013EBCFA3|nr:hypothetical protein [Schaalia sp. ZJ405]QPK80800.1 hypothetical protein G7Y41_06990 [Schaalia sp. ZJ405]
MRIRTIKPEFWTSPDISSLPIEDRLLFIGLWSYVDDNGVGRGEEQLIQASLFPLDEFTESFRRIHEGLMRLSERKLVTLYSVENRPYLFINAWEKHQKIGHPTKPRFPRPDNEKAVPHEDYMSPHENYTLGTGEQGNRGTELLPPVGPPTETDDEHTTNAPSASRKRSAKTTGTRLPENWTPSPDLEAWTANNCPLVPRAELDKFRDYWTSVAGARGRKADWDATWRNWARRTQEDLERKTAPNQTQVLTEMRNRAHAATIQQQGNALRLIETGETP